MSSRKSLHITGANKSLAIRPLKGRLLSDIIDSNVVMLFPCFSSPLRDQQAVSKQKSLQLAIAGNRWKPGKVHVEAGSGKTQQRKPGYQYGLRTASCSMGC